MKGAYKGCQALIAKKQPLAIYVHCAAHCLNLIASDVCSASANIHDSIALIMSLAFCAKHQANSSHSSVLFPHLMTKCVQEILNHCAQHIG